MKRTNAYETGDSLIEILITIAIVAVGVAGIVPAMANSLSATDRYRKHSKVDQVVTKVVDKVQSARYSCGNASSYDSKLAPLATLTGQSISVTALKYWTTANTFAGVTCPVTPNDGPIFRTQLVTIRVASPDNRSVRLIQIVKRP